jgi:hypothetical protein
VHLLAPGQAGTQQAAPLHDRAWGVMDACSGWCIEIPCVNIDRWREDRGEWRLGKWEGEALAGVIAPGAGGVEFYVLLPVLAGFEG